jgi:hypothetical protein
MSLNNCNLYWYQSQKASLKKKQKKRVFILHALASDRRCCRKQRCGRSIGAVTRPFKMGDVSGEVRFKFQSKVACYWTRVWMSSSTSWPVITTLQNSCSKFALQRHKGRVMPRFLISQNNWKFWLSFDRWGHNADSFHEMRWVASWTTWTWWNPLVEPLRL